jgi:hypothetical protein
MSSRIFHLKWTLFCPTSWLLVLLVMVDVCSWAKTIHITNDNRPAPFCDLGCETLVHCQVCRLVSSLVKSCLLCDPVYVVDWRLVDRVVLVCQIVSRLVSLWRQEIVIQLVHLLYLKEACV